MRYAIYKPMRQGGFEYSGDFEMKKKEDAKTWLVTKTVKFDADKLQIAKDKGVIHLLAERCRKQLDLLIADKRKK